jgi:hypothetical protein
MRRSRMVVPMVALRISVDGEQSFRFNVNADFG